MKPIISVEGLGKCYTIRHEGQTRYKSLREEIFKLPQRLLHRNAQSQEEFWALKDVRFDVMPGDRVGIIGRNGAGKSTLLKLLSRITEPTTGRITLRGRVASLLEVGTGFHPELSGRENIFLNGAILGMSRAEVRKKFDEIVDFAGVEKFLDTPVKRYSSGMYVRLAFAVAAHLEPEILIVDEVLAVGDAEFQKKCLGKMEDVGKSGRTVLFVSHNMAAMQQLCRYGILLSDGRITDNCDINAAWKKYQNINNQQKAQSEATEFDLKSRRPHGCIREIFTKINLFSIGGVCQSRFEMKSGMVIDFSIANLNDEKDIDFGVVIYDDAGARMTTYNTWMLGVNVEPCTQKLRITIPELFLSPGEYTVNACAARKTAGEYIDRIEPGIKFSIAESNMFSTGYSYSRTDGIFFQNAKMECL
ncbi:ABC transporter ATP-binding protein [Nitratidesulfovibrio sp. SRB-5]|uniref:ABC transporter ATP-binding protein n=1 Tax=Nitratidesulfovibrio sp. SRB-5 TaxID=2872636 RepID=UPI001027CA5D|nr:ABC transporter ATP-binding protein [Nitratidesulfovibrio sp. SRB-5]MBZ2170877.1 ABC transporter ATP-binding protein [Nitratidesulfovibrio sp. SRB-5]RXF78125.1 ABC transporter ATP-binding protein [Desulfovibrio sp. DS-1]